MDRRRVRRLSLFYSIHNKSAPDYLCDLMPLPVGSVSQYNLRNSNKVAMEIKRTYFDDIHQDVNKIKKYASDLQAFIGVNEMTSAVDREVKKQKGAFNYDLKGAIDGFEISFNMRIGRR
jgi:hypothetical protein